MFRCALETCLACFGAALCCRPLSLSFVWVRGFYPSIYLWSLHIKRRPGEERPRSPKWHSGFWTQSQTGSALPPVCLSNAWCPLTSWLHSLVGHAACSPLFRLFCRRCQFWSALSSSDVHYIVAPDEDLTKLASEIPIDELLSFP